jgi:hypothetical protein
MKEHLQREDRVGCYNLKLGRHVTRVTCPDWLPVLLRQDQGACGVYCSPGSQCSLREHGEHREHAKSS